MKKMLLLLLAALLLCQTALADVLIEVKDDFWQSHRSECESVYRQYTANGKDGYVALYESPVSGKQTETIKNGETLAGQWHYTDQSGDTWLALTNYVANEGYETVRGWVNTAQCIAIPDHTSFAGLHESEFTSFDPVFSSAFDGLDTLTLWTYPCSGKAVATDISTQWFQENTTPAEAFTTCWVDSQGRTWGLSAYCYGIRDAWVCLSDPANAEIAKDSTVVPQTQTVYPPAQTVPAPQSSGLGTTALILVGAVVVCTAALIPILFRKKRWERPQHGADS